MPCACSMSSVCSSFYSYYLDSYDFYDGLVVCDYQWGQSYRLTCSSSNTVSCCYIAHIDTLLEQYLIQAD